jgi:predicted DNA-binding transcriptional regulator AlpA
VSALITPALPNLEALVALLVPAVAAAVLQQQQQQQQQQDDAIYLVEQFCERNQISKSTWFKMKREGTGPRTISIGREVRISAAAEKEWRARKEQESMGAKERLAYKRRVKLSKRAAAAAVKSPKHVSRNPDKKKRRAEAARGGQ